MSESENQNPSFSERVSKSVQSAKAHIQHFRVADPLPIEEYIAVDSPNDFNKVLEYDEDIIGIRNFISESTSHPLQRLINYFISLFPILQWIHKYNVAWLYGDLIAGITVGIVAVPQAMSYAKIATLPAQYGLYSSFVGVFLYSFFATSKDVCIGPVAIMSLEVSRTIAKVVAKDPSLKDEGPKIAVTLSLLCGSIAAGIGFLRLGFLLEFIPLPAVMGYMTGSAFNIMVSQTPGLFGLSSVVNTRANTYQVFIQFWQHIGATTKDVAFGIPPLFLLFFLKWLTEFLTRRAPRYKIVWFYLSVLRNGIVIVVFTAISYGYNKNHREKPLISLIKTVPSGLRDVGVPVIDRHIVNLLAPELPVCTIVLLLEHISIAKSFGRINNYKVIPDQELVAIGVNNLIGVFFAAYPATGSFSRSALKAKCGVRTPLAGIFTGAVVLLALYALTSAFYWIPNATLNAVIIHAVFDLMVHPRVTWRLWKISPIEAIIFIVCVLITVFGTIEDGIYFAMCASAAFLLLRVAKAHGQFLGRVEYYELIDPTIISRDGSVVFDNKLVKQNFNGGIVENLGPSSSTASYDQKGNTTYGAVEETIDTDRDNYQHLADYNTDTIFEHREHPVKPPTAPLTTPHSHSAPVKPAFAKKYRWVPLSLREHNPDIKVLPPPPGVVVFKPGEAFIYPNASAQVDYVLDEVKRVTRPGIPSKSLTLADRSWNDGLPRRIDPATFRDDTRPLLRAVVFDMTASPQFDATGVQNLVDIKNAINRYANVETIEYHFVGVVSPWSRRALIGSGFGTGVPSHHAVDAAERDVSKLSFRKSQNVRSRNRNGITVFTTLDEEEEIDGVETVRPNKVIDEEEQTVEIVANGQIVASGASNHILLPIHGTNTPFFHFSMSELDHFYSDIPDDNESVESEFESNGSISGNEKKV